MWEGIQSWLYAMRPDISIAGLFLAALIHITKPKNETMLVWALAAAAFFTCTRFGDFQKGGIHSHDVWHYQMGSKYAEEIGYSGIYVAAAAALTELEAEGSVPKGTTPAEIRNLNDKSGELLKLTPEPLASAKSKFDARTWQKFRADMLGWHFTHNLQNWSGVLGDAGYNPSPWWSFTGATINKLFPTTASYRWMGLLDLLILAGAVTLITRTFGKTAAGYATILICLFPPGGQGWFDYTGMSYLRLSWVGWITAGVCAIHTKRYGLAGLCMALATLERVFPAAWVAASGIILIAQAFTASKEKEITGGKKSVEKLFKEKDRVAEFLLHCLTIITDKNIRRPIMQFIAGGLIATTAAVAVSTLAFGPKLWIEFLEYIPKHGTVLYTNHFGWLQGISLHPHINDVSIPKNNLAILNEWSNTLMSRNHQGPFVLLKLFLTGGILIWAFKKRDTIAATWGGLAIIFFTMLPAQYYLVGMLPGFAATFAENPSENKETRRLGSGTLIIAAILCVPLGTVGIAPWNIACTLVILALAAVIGHNLNTRNKLLTATFCGLGAALALVSPQFRTTPGGEPAKTIREHTQVTRNFILEENSKEIKDTGQIVPIGKSLKFTTTTEEGHTLHFRSDHMFAGKLKLLSINNDLIHEWNVKPRGYVFHTLSHPLPEGTHFQLKWEGPGQDIAIFSVWTTN